MNWKKLDIDIKNFAEKYADSTNESDYTFVEGRLTSYRLTEDTSIFYEIKHTKPIMEYGSKLRIYSKLNADIYLTVKSKLLGKPSLNSNINLSDPLKSQLQALGSEIGSFSWNTQLHHMGWPTNLAHSKTLTFQTRQIDQAVAQLESIREIHLKLLKEHHQWLSRK